MRSLLTGSNVTVRIGVIVGHVFSTLAWEVEMDIVVPQEGPKGNVPDAKTGILLDKLPLEEWYEEDIADDCHTGRRRE